MRPPRSGPDAISVVPGVPTGRPAAAIAGACAGGTLGGIDSAARTLLEACPDNLTHANRGGCGRRDDRKATTLKPGWVHMGNTCLRVCIRVDVCTCGSDLAGVLYR